MSDQQQQRASSLLSLIASRAISSSDKGNGCPGVASDDEQRTHTMMYQARMKYLQDEDKVKPDPLFMTRKQAQKVADSAKISLKKIDVPGGGHNHPRKPHAAETKLNMAASGVWKKPRPLLDDRLQTWVPVTQAGCHFWQSQETGECRSRAPPGWEGQPHPDTLRQLNACIGGRERSDGDDDPPFPPSFAFLNAR